MTTAITNKTHGENPGGRALVAIDADAHGAPVGARRAAHASSIRLP